MKIETFVPAPHILTHSVEDANDGAFRNAGGSVVGRLSSDRHLEKAGLDKSRHHLRSYGGWATETRHLDQLREVSGRGIRLVLVDGTVLESTLSAWEQHGFRPKGLDSDQTVLADCHWRTVSTPSGRQLALALA